MRRSDVNKVGFEEGNWNSGLHHIDRSTTELSGTPGEVDMLVQGLKLLILEKRRLEVLMPERAQGVAPVQELLDSIEQPQYEVPADTQLGDGPTLPSPEHREFMTSTFRAE